MTATRLIGIVTVLFASDGVLPDFLAGAADLLLWPVAGSPGACRLEGA